MKRHKLIKTWYAFQSKWVTFFETQSDGHYSDYAIYTKICKGLWKIEIAGLSEYGSTPKEALSNFNANKWNEMMGITPPKDCIEIKKML